MTALPKPLTSGAKVDGCFGKQDFVYRPEEDLYCCPAGETLKRHYTNVENGLTLRHPIKSRCTPAKERRSTRWEHEAVLEAVQRCLDKIRRPCACGERPSNTPSARSRPGWARRTS